MRRVKRHVALGKGVQREGEQEPGSGSVADTVGVSRQSEAILPGGSPAGDRSAAPGPDKPLPVWRLGVLGGMVGILCCVGPTVLALFGAVTAATAFAWATQLYGSYAWWFRLAGVVTLAVLVAVALRRRGQCNLRGLSRWRLRLAAVLGIACGTYAVLYGVTTWLGTLS